jgi:phosphopantothenoylcysteine decarboxylase/phosphopantothenate--cysteine ligase
MLTGKKIVLGVTGGIAAYKAAEILRSLKKKEADVAVVMTETATKFVGPVTFEALSGRPVSLDMFDPTAGGMEHLALGRWADLVLIAPATANTIARLAAGLADNLLCTLTLAANAPVLIAPAMNTRMILHPATQANLATLGARGVHIMTPGTGPLAEEEEGYGRLPSPEEIVERVCAILIPRQDLAGRRLLVTAGPTREALDPVRYLSNRSSGKMGFAVAARAVRRGAEVTLVHGPVSLSPPAGVRAVAVTSAEEMLTAVRDHFPSCDSLIMAAAVADYRPLAPADRKIKKSGSGQAEMLLEETADILGAVTADKGPRVVVGFAAETDGLEENARRKLEEKNLDMIVANDVTLPGAGFDGDTNQVEIFTRSGEHTRTPLLSKEEVAEKILTQLAPLLSGENSGR